MSDLCGLMVLEVCPAPGLLSSWLTQPHGSTFCVSLEDSVPSLALTVDSHWNARKLGSSNDEA